MKSKFSRIVDSVALAIGLWLLTVITLRYFIGGFALSALVSLVLSMALMSLIGIRSKRQREQESEALQAAECCRHFLFRDQRYALEYFFKAYQGRYDVQKKKYYLRIKDTIIVPALSEPLCLKAAVQFYADALREKAKILVVLTPKTDKSFFGAKEHLNDLRFEVFEAEKTLRLLKSLDAVPKPNGKEKRMGRVKRRELFAEALSPNRAKAYLFSTFVLLPGAYFSVFPLYFLIFAALSLSMAVLCRLRIAERIKGYSAGGDGGGVTDSASSLS